MKASHQLQRCLVVEVVVLDQVVNSDTCRVANDAVPQALDAFRGKPNRIGMDDPGMVALQRMVDGL